MMAVQEGERNKKEGDKVQQQTEENAATPASACNAIVTAKAFTFYVTKVNRNKEPRAQKGKGKGW